MPAKRAANSVKLAEPPVAAATFKKFFQDMLLIRRFEERASQMYGMRLIGGFCHPNGRCRRPDEGCSS